MRKPYTDASANAVLNSSTIEFRGKANAGGKVVCPPNLSAPHQVICFRNSAPSLIFVLSVGIRASNRSEMLLSHLQLESLFLDNSSQ